MESSWFYQLKTSKIQIMHFRIFVSFYWHGLEIFSWNALLLIFYHSLPWIIGFGLVVGQACFYSANVYIIMLYLFRNQTESKLFKIFLYQYQVNSTFCVKLFWTQFSCRYCDQAVGMMIFRLVITWLWGWFGICHQSYFLSILKSPRASVS